MDVIDADQTKALVGGGGIKLPAFACQLVQIRQQSPQWLLDFQHPCRRHQFAPRGGQQRIIEQAPQARKLRGHGWLIPIRPAAAVTRSVSKSASNASSNPISACFKSTQMMPVMYRIDFSDVMGVSRLPATRSME